MKQSFYINYKVLHSTLVLNHSFCFSANLHPLFQHKTVPQPVHSSLSLLSALWNCQSHFYISRAAVIWMRVDIDCRWKKWRLTCWLKLSTSCLTESHSILRVSPKLSARIRLESRNVFVQSKTPFNQNTLAHNFFYLKLCLSHTRLIFMTSPKGSETRNLEKPPTDWYKVSLQ